MSLDGANVEKLNRAVESALFFLKKKLVNRWFITCGYFSNLLVLPNTTGCTFGGLFSYYAIYLLAFFTCDPIGLDVVCEHEMCVCVLLVH